ncbi:PREDICTED: ester hydrolase C11orf54 homolog isoform X2 [Elephantulus edwardii]|uniref:ester hydrolase C11orf54 homolog isoform X2 n=1 Tax=Elephantulus edwardii TaxID=28737 RepID=UPI0003F08DAF|nr:PREDICTED: ester hydrolase C11orf54 homolog isoform X2 [Elephantulus edwardii]
MACAEFPFHVPSLSELAEVLQKGLKDNFADVHVSVVDCPDLTKSPFTFPAKGICGKTRIIEVGGVPYLLPLVNKTKVYDLNKIAQEIKFPGAFILGAGAGPFQTLGFNAEFMPIVQTASEKKSPVNGSYFAQVNPADGDCLLEKYSEKYHDFGCALLANLFASEGQPGKPAEFPSCPLNSDDDVNKWLRFYEMQAPLVCLPVFVSRDPGFDLRLEHTHFFSHHGKGGHYHYDTSPDTVEYLGYFSPAEFLFRIDRPKETHSIGRD